jgi:hypothetical protein
MFCPHCHRPVCYKDPDNKGWCEHCRRVINVAPCSVSLWCVAAVMLLPWMV